MSAFDPKVCRANDRVADALRLMQQYKIDELPVSASIFLTLLIMFQGLMNCPFLMLIGRPVVSVRIVTFVPLINPDAATSLKLAVSAISVTSPVDVIGEDDAIAS